MIELIWDLYQQKGISSAKWDAANAQDKARDAVSKAQDLEGAVDRLLLVTHALWEILQQLHPVTDEQLLAKIQEIDLRDGRLDGKYNVRQIRKCSSCGKVVNVRRTQCIYCGSRDVQTKPFETVK